MTKIAIIILIAFIIGGMAGYSVHKCPKTADVERDTIRFEDIHRIDSLEAIVGTVSGKLGSALVDNRIYRGRWIETKKLCDQMLLQDTSGKFMSVVVSEFDTIASINITTFDPVTNKTENLKETPRVSVSGRYLFPPVNRFDSIRVALLSPILIPSRSMTVKETIYREKPRPFISIFVAGGFAKSWDGGNALPGIGTGLSFRIDRSVDLDVFPMAMGSKPQMYYGAMLRWRPLEATD